MQFRSRGSFAPRVAWSAAGALFLGSPLLASAALAAPAATSTAGVTGADTWVAQAYFCDGNDYTPNQADVFGPNPAPFGPGSHQATLNDNDLRTELYRTPAYDGTPLGDLSRLDYSTFATATDAGTGLRQPTYLRLNVDNDGDGATDASLFFFPANNTDSNGDGVKNDAWQNWSTIDGQWGVGGDSSYTTLADYVAANPDATIVNNSANGTDANGGGVALIVGCGQGGSNDSQINGRYDVDRVVVGLTDGTTTLYDLGKRDTDAGTTDDITVDPAARHAWVSRAFFNDPNYEELDSNQTFVKGPGNPPLGVGSLRAAVGSNGNRIEQFRTAQYDGQALRRLTTLDFSTYEQATAGNDTAQQPFYLRLNVDSDGNGQFDPGAGDEQLFFFPANNGSVQQSTWQDWNAGDGVWSVGGDAGPADSFPLDQYVAEHPDARIGSEGNQDGTNGGVTFMVGGGGSDYDAQRNGEYFLDAVKVGFVDAATSRTPAIDVFDLEPTMPQVSVGDAKVKEGNGDTAVLTFPVTIDHVFGDDVTVDYQTEDGTAVAGEDYVATTGTATIPAGSTSTTVSVPVVGDKVAEPKESMSLVLTDPAYGDLADGTGEGVIVDNDTSVELNLRNAKGPKVRAVVSTTPAAKGRSVSLYGGEVGSKSTTLFNGRLDSAGTLDKVLAQQFDRGTKVEVYAKVFTKQGTYRSATATITVR